MSLKPSPTTVDFRTNRPARPTFPAAPATIQPQNPNTYLQNPGNGIIPSGNAAPAAAQAPPSSGGISMDDVRQFLDSRGGQTVATMGGAALDAFAANQRANADRAQRASEFGANAAQVQFNADRTHNTNAAGLVAQNDPLGASQEYAQKMALLNAIMPNLRNARSTPGDPAVAAAMPTRGGSMNMIPEGGFDPAMIERLYGDEATMASLAKRDKQLLNIDSRAPQTDLATLFGSEEAQPHLAEVAKWQATLQELQGADRQKFEDRMNQEIQKRAEKEQGSGFWKKFAKIALVVGLGAATVATAGAMGPVMGAVVAGGLNAAATKAQGGSWTDSALAGAIGAIPGGGAGNAARMSATEVVKQVARNPNTYTSAFNAARG